MLLHANTADLSGTIAPGYVVASADLFVMMAQALLESLKDEVHIAVRVCDAIGYLAEGFTGFSGQSSPLSPFFKEIITVLLTTAQRQDPHADSPRLQISAFEAINEMVRAASPDTLDTVAQLIPVFLQEVLNTFNLAISSGDAREKQAELQGQLCGVLQVRQGVMANH